MGMTIALPSGKSLQESTEILFGDARIRIKREHSRACAAVIEGLPGIDRAIFCRHATIPQLVRDRDVDIGITGMDCVREQGESRNGKEPDVRIFAEFQYSRSTNGGTRCVVFCKNDHRANRLSDMEPNPVIATEYPVETREQLHASGIVDPKLVEYPGSVESLVVLGKYPYGVALTETGDTLRANGLKIIAEIFTSQTVLVGRLRGYKSREIEQIMFLGKLLVGTLAARGKTYLLMNAPTDSVEVIKRILPSLKSPTIQSLADREFVSVAAVVPNADVNSLMFRLSREGASDFVTLPPSTVM